MLRGVYIGFLTLPILCGNVNAEEAIDYIREIKPILMRRCASCHGAVRQQANLRLDTAELLKKGGESGSVVSIDSPDQSLLISRITAVDDSLRMPPPGEGTPLSGEEIDLLKRWMKEGTVAPHEDVPSDPRHHWAFQVPVRKEVPSLAQHPIDAFLEVLRKEQGLTASPPISPDLWLRRLSLDLTGLPPARSELKAFRADHSSEATSAVIDRLLNSPHYGERWARHWMDIWRYSDWYGLGEELRFSHYHIWRWRDWIIESLNDDMGYDQMVIAMLAGDEVAPDDPDTLRATGFLARNWDIFSRNKWLDMTIEHTSRAFLGVTMQCARCHDHKFDPVSQEDYYRLRAVFEPFQIRIDRFAGQLDRNKDGVVRIFDDLTEAPTWLYVRGEETQPDQTRPLSPGVPAVLGGDFQIHTVALPLGAQVPDKRPEIIQEVRDQARNALATAHDAMLKARQLLLAAQESEKAAVMAADNAQRILNDLQQSTSAPSAEALTNAKSSAAAAAERSAKAAIAAAAALRDLLRSEAARTAAESRQTSILAVLEAEKLQDDCDASTDTAGEDSDASTTLQTAAFAASHAQRQQAVAEAKLAELTAAQDVANATTLLDGFTAAHAAAAAAEVAKPADETLKTRTVSLQAALTEAAGKLTESRSKLQLARTELSRAEAAATEPPSTKYTPRPLEFHRAKMTYRDTPSTAPFPKVSTGRRLALARWMADRRNPLTARVAVNHIWARHFGEPLVNNVFDFGLRSPRPVHQDLLDWLAVELIESGWSMKHLHRLIVSSDAYRMQSSPPNVLDSRIAADPDNIYYWRMNSRRMEAEIIRDSLLHAAGRLDKTQFGPDLPVATAENGSRRTIYYRYARGDRMLFLTMFDAPSVEECYRRPETIVPQQALALVNSQMAIDRADDIAAALTTELGDVPDAVFVTAAFEQLLGREPGQEERHQVVQWLQRVTSEQHDETIELARQTKAPEVAKAEDQPKATATPQEESGRPPSAQMTARSAFIHVLINHNDFVTIR